MSETNPRPAMPDAAEMLRMWNTRYGEDGYAYGTAPNDFLVGAAAHIPAGGRVLCLAEGEGRNAVYLASRGFDVLAMDQSAVGLAKAQKLAAERSVSVTTQTADLNTFVIEPGAWDGIVSIFAHLPPPLRKRVHAACVTGLRPGGVMILEAYTPDQVGRGTGGPPVREMMMTLDGLSEEFAGLEVVVGQELEREIHEGPFHDGMSAVVQLIAQKPA